MKTLILSAALVAGVGALGASARAMPVVNASAVVTSGLIEVRNGCGAGWHRGPYGYCRPNGAVYAYGPYPVYAPPPPRCWWVATPYGSRRVCRW
ncbi:MAG: hypothetical protein GC182_01510 [Rhodopseudomonas sp.]|nr:hypothetical protein [Rhodopseudomonas sp.]